MILANSSTARSLQHIQRLFGAGAEGAGVTVGAIAGATLEVVDECGEGLALAVVEIGLV
jgi:hypothetical protein